MDARSLKVNTTQSNRQQTFGNWGVGDAGDLGDEFYNNLEAFSFRDVFDDFDLQDHQNFGARAIDPAALYEYTVDFYRNQAIANANGDPEAIQAANDTYVFGYDPNFSVNDTLEEDTIALYFQFSVDGELAGMETNLTAGLRYEDTDVSSYSDINLPEYRIWQDDNDFLSEFSDSPTPFRVDTGYDNLLPSLDFSINFTDDLKGRFSYSKTIARPSYGNLSTVVSNFANNGSGLISTTNIPSASAANPRLIPLESDNTDLSLEWYYGDTSYASVGFFEKRVQNFIGTEQNIENVYDLQDQTVGPRAQAALAELQDRGLALTNANLFVMTSILDNPEIYTNGADDFVVDPAAPTNVLTAFQVEVAALGGITPNADDPLMDIRVARPVNNREAQLYGAEFAVQHFFGDSGFGVQANYTVVRGDVAFDNEADPGEQQFALLGLSDTANVVAIYEDFGFSARLALNWRDQFLNETNRGSGNAPVYVEAYHQFDLNVAYDVTDSINVFLEGINITGEDVRHHARNKNQLWFLEDLGARWNLGARYVF